jgi:hypothetical protein
MSAPAKSSGLEQSEHEAIQKALRTIKEQTDKASRLKESDSSDGRQKKRLATYQQAIEADCAKLARQVDSFCSRAPIGSSSKKPIPDQQRQLMRQLHTLLVHN